MTRVEESKVVSAEHRKVMQSIAEKVIGICIEMSGVVSGIEKRKAG